MTTPTMPDDPMLQLVEHALRMTERAIDPGETIIGRVDHNGKTYDIRRYRKPRIVEATKERR